MIIITIILIRWRLVHLPGQQVGAFQVEGAADNARGDHDCRDGGDLYDDDHDCHDARGDHDLNDDDLDDNDDK